MFNLNEISKDFSSVSFTIMEHAGYKASLMRAERLRGDGEFGLPSGIPISVVPVSCLPGIPREWIVDAGSYVVPVDSEVGLWFDWTMNDNCVGVIPSVKGMNPITGRKIDELRLEHYRDKCPVHDIDLSHNRYCEECGYNLPPQNMVSYPNVLWWDGFRQPDGTVRQFFFTDKDKRDVASAIMGRKKTVPAFGFAFFRTKKERFVNNYSPRSISKGDNYTITYDNAIYYSDSSASDVNYVFSTMSSTSSNSVTYNNITTVRGVELQGFNTNELESDNSVSKEVSVGAGAIIKQNLEVDTLPLDDWHQKPQAIIRLYFVFKDQLKDIVKKGGIKDFKNNKEGYLSEVEVG